MPDGYSGEGARSWGQMKGNLGPQTSAHKVLGCPGAHAHSTVCAHHRDDLIYTHDLTSHLFQIYISSPRLGSRVISIDPLPPGQPGDVGVGRACTGLCISCLFLVRVQAWRHLDRWGLDSRELTLQEITGARALFGALPPTLGTSQSTWRIQGQLVSQPQGPMERAVCISRAPRAQDVACAVRTARVPRTWHARCVLRMRRAFWVDSVPEGCVGPRAGELGCLSTTASG